MKRKAKQEDLMNVAAGILLSFVFQFVLVTVPDVHGQSNFPAFPGNTFEQRKQAYINDQGKAWERWYPGAMVHAIWAWLEKPAGNKARISKEIEYLTGDNAMGWKNAWWDGDHRTPIFAIRIYMQYYKQKKVISDADAEKLKEKLNIIATRSNVWCAVANYHFRYIVTAYLYATLIEDIGDVKFQDPTNEAGACPKTFTYNGRQYIRGQFYDAKKIYRDFLNHKIDQWLKKGDQEDFGGYYYAQVHSMAALADFALDPELKQKGKMLYDFLIFNWAVSFSANHPGGGHGRHYVKNEKPGLQSFPWTIYFNLYGKADIGRKWSYADAYVFQHRFPQLFTDIVEMKNEGDDFYRIVRGNIPNLSGKNDYSVLPRAHRYDYITKYYNLGGANFGTGWELNIEAQDVPFKLWINQYENEPDPDDQNDQNWPNIPLTSLGTFSYQHRNALYYTGGGYLHQWLGDNRWDAQSEESGWNFFRKGKVSVAVKMSVSGPGALEVATIGVDYSSYNDFKTAIKNNADLSGGFFKTSKGFVINKGYVDYGNEFTQLPFDRLEVWEGRVSRNDERKIVDWRNNVMHVAKYGNEVFYNFNTWTIHKEG
ncbi:MAG: hypothetical protein ACE5GL_08135, partial [Calditrichia bacterium]